LQSSIGRRQSHALQSFTQHADKVVDPHLGSRAATLALITQTSPPRRAMMSMPGDLPHAISVVQSWAESHEARCRFTSSSDSIEAGVEGDAGGISGTEGARPPGKIPIRPSGRSRRSMRPPCSSARQAWFTSCWGAPAQISLLIGVQFCPHNLFTEAIVLKRYFAISWGQFWAPLSTPPDGQIFVDYQRLSIAGGRGQVCTSIHTLPSPARSLAA